MSNTQKIHEGRKDTYLQVQIPDSEVNKKNSSKSINNCMTEIKWEEIAYYIGFKYTFIYERKSCQLKGHNEK